MSSFIKNVFSLISGNIAAQVISIATMPLVTRLYSPSDFGVFAVFLSTLALLGPVSTLRFNEVVILPEDQRDSFNLFALSCTSSFLFAVTILFFVILFQVFLLPEYLSGMKGCGNYIWLIPLAILFRGTLLSVNSLTMRQAKFKKLAVATVLNTACNRFMVIVLGIFAQVGAWGLITGRLSGVACGIIYITRTSVVKLISEIRRGVSIGEMKRLARKYREFPFFGTWSILLHNASKELPVFILAWFFSSPIAGLYSLGANMIQMPMTMVGYSLNRVFLQKAVTIRKNRRILTQETIRFISYLIYIILPVIITLIFLGDRLFDLLFGNNWLEAGKYAQILAPSFFFIFLFISLRSFFIVFERPRERLIFDIIYFISRAGVLLIAAVLTESPYLSLMAMSLMTCILLSFFLIYICSLLSLSRFYLIKLILQKVFFMTPLIGGLTIIKFCLAPHQFISIMALILLLFLQGALIFFKEPLLKKKVMGYFFA